MELFSSCLLDSAANDTAHAGLCEQFIDPSAWQNIKIGLYPEATVALKQGIAKLAAIQLRETLYIQPAGY
ncbi:hypothetical protein SBOR_6175 [Sclerotinia borealis F-4128]|uniref:Uncharacterized protein n=1 Tax=Sclerotinia borealis (strain F-4128) TaxID=1432307 RepID=W9CC92_SCLBF|nr:hypothetical protein SBOR_6175 [Sclerotinia borealis F-4128]